MSDPVGLPDFSGGTRSNGDVGAGHGPGPGGARGTGADTGSPPADPQMEALNAVNRQRSGHGAVIGVVIGGVVAIIVAGLFISQVAMRSVEAGPLFDGPDPLAPVNTQGDPNRVEETFVPPEASDPPPAIFTEAPSSACTMSKREGRSSSSTVSRVQGGGLSFPLPAGWSPGWSGTNVPYLFDSDGASTPVERHWYSAMTLGRIDWPASEGPYPGLEAMATSMFQCYATHANVVQEFGAHPEVSDYRSKPTTVDGHEAWIVQATYTFDQSTSLVTTNSSVVTAIVVNTPGGPSTFVSDVAADRPEHVAQLKRTISELTVVG